MALTSMTGFARHDGQYKDIAWVWEIRSVNGKGLDLRFRIPQGYESLEGKARKIAQSNLNRGNVQISLQIRQTSSNLVPVVNEAALDTIIRAAEQLREKVGGELPTVADLLGYRGVVEFEEVAHSQEERSDLEGKIQESFSEAIKALCEARSREGVSLTRVVKKQIETISELKNAIEDDTERAPDAIRTRLKAQLDLLLEDRDGIDPARLHQEVALLAAKSDIREELDRLSVHLDTASQLLSEDGPVGRKLDFLSQEFNRECNTICSKSNASSVSAKGLDMKLVIDQFREQIQNLE